jgi:spore germination cell wall hydrolase CwlJ-like protein
MRMNCKILALLFTVALTATAGAAQACGGNRFNAPAESVLAAANNPVLPPVAEQANHSYYGAGASASASGTLNNRGEVRGTTLNLATSTIASWMHKIKTFLDPLIIEKNCLATAVYFEARSESQQGQLAVATVILNRVKASNYSTSICGVVYKGASHFNACQFSFACDGKSDVPEDARAWETALAVTAMVLADDRKMKDKQMQIVATATHYHADYVDPYWSKSLNRLTKIGRHIFYSQG